jgi:hypothetical protein
MWSGTDHCTAAGAERLAESIRKFWQAKGLDIKIKTERVASDRSSTAGPIYGLRSVTLNGYPARGEMRIEQSFSVVADDGFRLRSFTSREEAEAFLRRFSIVAAKEQEQAEAQADT